MTGFTCSCGNELYFDNTHCVGCGAAVGFCMVENTIKVVSIPSNQTPEDVGYRWCANAPKGLCNWFVPASCPDEFCPSCALTRVVPDLSAPENVAKMATFEAAKRRLLFNLTSVGLHVVPKSQDPARGLVFELRQSLGDQRVITGHAEGVITIDVDEADPVHIELQRCALRENYRTLLGHLRHESGHYYFDRLVADQGLHEPFRAVFGDEREEYAAALQRHYESGGNADWRANFISEYASCHPWEDWAETWAHYLHCHATSETARSRGLTAKNPATEGGTANFFAGSIKREDFDAFMKFWEETVILMNEMNRSMGVGEPYPFQLTSTVADKLFFIHNVVRGADLRVSRAA
jgi:hypothetical protein